MNLQDLGSLDLKDIDFSRVGSWPLAGRASLMALLCIAIAGAGYWFFIKDRLTELERIEQQEQDLKLALETKQRQAASLESYEKQLEEMRLSFGAMLRQLPGKAEIAGLLTDISQTRVAAGLEEELFKPDAEVPRDFYAELPIRMRLLGNYHQLGEFVSDVAALPRIVTLHDIRLSPTKPKPDATPTPDLTGTPSAPAQQLLLMEVTAKTYRYLEDEEIKQ